MAQIDNHSDPKARQGRQHRQELAPHQPSCRNAAKKFLLHKILTYIHFHPEQHGFWSKHSAYTVLLTITTGIAAGFSLKKLAHRTVLVALYLIAAYNNVVHQQLLDCVYNTNIPATIRRWLHNYLQNRGVIVRFRQQVSKSRKVITGVIHDGVLSPSLFNYYLADFPTPPPNFKLIKYANDITHPVEW